MNPQAGTPMDCNKLPPGFAKEQILLTAFRSRHRLGEDHTIPIKVQNQHPTLQLPAGQVVHAESSYVHRSVVRVPSIGAGLSWKGELHVTVKGGMTWQSIPKTSSFHYFGNTVTYSTSVDDVSGELANCRPMHVPRLNILVFGVDGAGKSSSINKFLTIIDTSPHVVHAAPTAGGERHVTTTLAKYALGDYITIWDTWGFTGENYNDQTLNYILAGRLPGGWEMRTLDAQSRKFVAEHGDSTKHNRRIHAAILVLAAPYIVQNVEHDIITETIRNKLREFRELVPIVLVTQIDQTGDADLSFTELRRKWGPAVERMTTVPARDVYFSESYHDTDQRTFKRDLQGFAALQAALRNAQRFEKLYGAADVRPPTAGSGRTTAADYDFS
eukprot:TRINITY_DN68630_c0_g1_i1.p1 TRINITY_DN68630_c0_g1~~TRINITY_DN68630_c0_g1_i1.p1  ORF type:complete len:385 (+),score=64.59 TRINITY_DN68630_c0_g1_i1:107-1261(+)